MVWSLSRGRCHVVVVAWSLSSYLVHAYIYLSYCSFDRCDASGRRCSHRGQTVDGTRAAEKELRRSPQAMVRSPKPDISLLGASRFPLPCRALPEPCAVPYLIFASPWAWPCLSEPRFAEPLPSLAFAEPCLAEPCLGVIFLGLPRLASCCLASLSRSAFRSLTRHLSSPLSPLYLRYFRSVDGSGLSCTRRRTCSCQSSR